MKKGLIIGFAVFIDAFQAFLYAGLIALGGVIPVLGWAASPILGYVLSLAFGLGFGSMLIMLLIHNRMFSLWGTGATIIAEAIPFINGFGGWTLLAVRSTLLHKKTLLGAAAAVATGGAVGSVTHANDNTAQPSPYTGAVLPAQEPAPEDAPEPQSAPSRAPLLNKDIVPRRAANDNKPYAAAA